MLKDRKQKYQQEYNKKWYKENRIERRKEIENRKEEIRKWFESLKRNMKCSKCEEDHPSCIEFHHIDPRKKDLDISLMVKDGYSKRRIREEMEKCIILCSNCHRKVHYNQQTVISIKEEKTVKKETDLLDFI